MKFCENCYGSSLIEESNLIILLSEISDNWISIESEETQAYELLLLLNTKINGLDNSMAFLGKSIESSH